MRDIWSLFSFFSYCDDKEVGDTDLSISASSSLSSSNSSGVSNISIDTEDFYGDFDGNIV